MNSKNNLNDKRAISRLFYLIVQPTTALVTASYRMYGVEAFPRYGNGKDCRCKANRSCRHHNDQMKMESLSRQE